MDWSVLVGLLVVGGIAGFLSALFGIGGGIVIVPILHYVGHVEWHMATGLSLLAIAVQSPTGVWQHARRGFVDWRIAVPMSVAGLAGVWFGIVLEPHLPVPWLKVFFALLMALAAWRLVGRLRILAPGSPPPGMPSLLALGALGGVASKLLGIGGGLVTVPVLAFAGVPVHLAVGSSLVPVFTNAAMASAQALAGGLAWLLAVPIAVGALAAVPLGARAAHALPERALRQVFAGGLVAGALYIGLTSGVF